MQPLLLSIFLVVRRSLKPELRKRSCHAVSLRSLTTDQGPGGVISVGNNLQIRHDFQWHICGKNICPLGIYSPLAIEWLLLK